MNALDTELADLASSPLQRQFLELAADNWATLDRGEQLAVSGQVYGLMTIGSAGAQLGAWEELRLSVSVWFAWRDDPDLTFLPHESIVRGNVARALADCEKLCRQPRERAVPCSKCRRETWNVSARCDMCTGTSDDVR